jgi:succinyl-CoA synthetase alpha subunit
MGILIDEKTSVIVLGITGREGSVRAAYMKAYGTRVVAGVTPGRGGTEVTGIPVYDSIEEAKQRHGPIHACAAFVPGPSLRDAVIASIEAGIKLIVAPAERVPLHDILEMVYVAKRAGASVLGPGSIGILNPGKAILGWLGGSLEWARTIFVPGHVGVISRSGGQATTVTWTLQGVGLGVSTVAHVGSEPVTGLSMGELLRLFEEDDETEAVAAFGEIGGSHEEEAAQCIRERGFTKPFVIFVAGAWAPPGMRFSHASSIIERGRGSADGKNALLRAAGAHVVDRPELIAPTVKKLLNDMGENAGGQRCAPDETKSTRV